MRRFAGNVLVVAAVGLLAGCGRDGISGPSGNDAEALMAMERMWAHAVMSHDASGLEEFLAEDFTQTSETGEVRGRDETIARARSSTAVFSSGGLEDMRVRLDGDAAVVTGRFRAAGRSGDEAFTVDVRWTDTFVRRGGRWLCLASHSSSVTEN